MILDKLKAIFKPNHNPAKSITEIGLSIRTQNILRRAGIAIVGDLTQLSWKDIAGMRRANRRMCEEVEKVLDGMGLKLREEK